MDAQEKFFLQFQRHLAQARHGPPRRWVWFLAGATASAVIIKINDEKTLLGTAWKIGRFIQGAPSQIGEKWQQYREARQQAKAQQADGTSPPQDNKPMESLSKQLGLNDETKAQVAEKGRQAFTKIRQVSGDGIGKVNGFFGRGKVQNEQQPAPEITQDKDDSSTLPPRHRLDSSHAEYP